MEVNIKQNMRLANCQPATAEKKRARDGVLATRARGGTVLRPAISTAYKYASMTAIEWGYLSDGLTEQQERQTLLLQLIQNRQGNTRVLCVGGGNDVERPLLEKMGRFGRLAAFISRATI